MPAATGDFLQFPPQPCYSLLANGTHSQSREAMNRQSVWLFVARMEVTMWALFFCGERVSRLFRNEKEAVRAARVSGLFDNDVLLENYEIRRVREPHQAA